MLNSVCLNYTELLKLRVRNIPLLSSEHATHMFLEIVLCKETEDYIEQ